MLTTRIRFIWVLAVSTLLQGCALLPFSSDAPAPTSSEQGEFTAVVSTMNGPLAVPVEIAKDIATITAGGKVRPKDSVPAPEDPKAVLSTKPTDSTETSEVVADGTKTEEAAPKSPETSPKLAAVTKSAKSKSRHPAQTTSGQYTVKNGDTLMKIAFEKFGNVYRWKEIYQENKTKIPNLNSLTAGTVLTIQGIEYVVIQRNGLPYLIRRGDTLVKISDSVYDTKALWKKIWRNNPQLIRDPNKIYAGFTLYYEPKEKPQVAPVASSAKPQRVPAATDEH